MEAALVSPDRSQYRPPSPVRETYPFERILSFVVGFTCLYVSANKCHRGDIDSDEESAAFTFRIPFNTSIRGPAEECEDVEESEEEPGDESITSSIHPHLYLRRLQDEYVKPYFECSSH